LVKAHHEINSLVNDETPGQAPHYANVWEEHEAKAHENVNHESYNNDEVSNLNHSDGTVDYHDHDASMIGNEHPIDTTPAHEKSFWEELFGGDDGVDVGDDGGDFFGF